MIPAELARRRRVSNQVYEASMTMAPPEKEIVDAWRVACDGGEGALGHPRVWLSLDRVSGQVECGYCDKLFVHRSFADAGADTPEAQKG